MTAEELYALASAIEAAPRHDLHRFNDRFCAVFGVHQERLARAGWKRWYPETRRWGSPLRPLNSHDDLISLMGRQAPPMINVDRQAACVEILRHRADGMHQ